MRRLIKILPLLIFCIIFLAGCKNRVIETQSVDLSKMDESTMYDEYTISNVAVIEGKVYYCHKLDNTSEPEVQILRLDTNEPSIIYEGHIYNIRAYGKWMYFKEETDGNALWRIDLTSGAVEKILDEVLRFIISPAGIFWADNKAISIQHADLDGRNISTIFELENGDYRRIGGLSLFHYSLYFKAIPAESPRYDVISYRIDLNTKSVYKIPEHSLLQKSNENISKMSDAVHLFIKKEPIRLWLYELQSGIFAAENGWTYNYINMIWYDQETKLFELSTQQGYILKTIEDGTQKRVLFKRSESADYFTVRNGWIYFIENSKLKRIKEDGENTHTIIEDSIKLIDVFNGYVYYSLLSDKNEKPIKDNLFRINLDTLGKPEQLY